MKNFYFYSSISGIHLGTYLAESKTDAIDKFVQDCGYKSWAELVEINAPAFADDALIISTDDNQSWTWRMTP